MAISKQQVPAGTLRTASIIILAFAAAVLLFGLNMFQVGSNPGSTARELQGSGLPGTVTDARVNVGHGGDGLQHVFRVELIFMGSDGTEHSLTTNHFPRDPAPSTSTQGWVEDFPTKAEIVGQPVRYRLGESPAVELEREIPVLVTAGWSFPNYLGLGLMVLGVGAGVGGTVSLVRAMRRIREG
ncbi:hypothetical protein AS189_05210 [Arthrobacter alpinus]|uniref:Uncharacterized protein n=1 Tax=Arthrobacter alpinus TaxID=656366 RepID=A0A0S2LX23_9MICC|nr:hypothetical protein [Arthrobacter alpinus]ALO66002.1 hypothetical protein AS189_05210 [Arthrobacter alpinus]